MRKASSDAVSAGRCPRIVSITSLTVSKCTTSGGLGSRCGGCGKQTEQDEKRPQQQNEQRATLAQPADSSKRSRKFTTVKWVSNWHQCTRRVSLPAGLAAAAAARTPIAAPIAGLAAAAPAQRSSRPRPRRAFRLQACRQLGSHSAPLRARQTLPVPPPSQADHTLFSQETRSRVLRIAFVPCGDLSRQAGRRLDRRILGSCNGGAAAEQPSVAVDLTLMAFGCCAGCCACACAGCCACCCCGGCCCG